MTRLCSIAVVVVALLVAGAGAAAGNPVGSPGLRVAITNSGLTEFKDIALPIINAAFQDLTLPGMDLQEHVPVLGHITLDLSNIKVTGFHLPDANFAFAPPDALNTDLSDMTLTVGLDYRWRKVHWPHISDHGSVTATPSGTTITASLGITAVDGRPHLAVLSSSVNVDSFKIHFDGKVGWLYNLLVGLFKGAIKKAVVGAVQKSLNTALAGSLNKAFAKLKTTQYLGGGKSRMTVNTSVTTFTFGSDYMSVADDLGIRNNMTGAACPYVPATLPPVTPGSNGDMLQMLMDDSFLNCMLWTSDVNGALDVVLNNSMIPPTSKFRLNTTDWKDLIPQLYAEFPNKAMQIAISPITAPKVATAPTGMTAVGDLHLNFSVVTAPNALVHVFELGALANLGIDIKVAPKNNTPTLFPSVTTLSMNVTVEQSSIGAITIAPLQGLFNALLPGIKVVLDLILANGIPLPSIDGLSLVDPTVQFDQGFFAIATNFAFKPPAATPHAEG